MMKKIKLEAAQAAVPKYVAALAALIAHVMASPEFDKAAKRKKVLAALAMMDGGIPESYVAPTLDAFVKEILSADPATKTSHGSIKEAARRGGPTLDSFLDGLGIPHKPSPAKTPLDEFMDAILLP